MGIKFDTISFTDADGNVLEFGKRYVHVPTGRTGVPYYFAVEEEGCYAIFDFSGNRDTEIEDETISVSELSGSLSETQRARAAVNTFVDNNRDIFKGIDIERFTSILDFIGSNYDLIKTAYPAAFADD